jgi:hypothetical protein
MEDEKIFQSAIILDRFYEKVGRAAAGIGQCPRIIKFKAGYGYLNESVPEGKPPEILSVPYDLEEVPEPFYTGSVDAQFSNGSTLVKCTIPEGGIATSKRCSVIGLYDQDEELVAMCVALPDWVKPSQEYTVYPSINFPINRKGE